VEAAAVMAAAAAAVLVVVVVQKQDRLTTGVKNGSSVQNANAVLVTEYFNIL